MYKLCTINCTYRTNRAFIVHTQNNIVSPESFQSQVSSDSSCRVRLLVRKASPGNTSLQPGFLSMRDADDVESE